MKKFKLTFVTLLATLGLVACGGGDPVESQESKEPGQSQTESKTESKTESNASSEKHVHTFDETKWEANDTQHWHPATCEHTTQKGSAEAHKLEEDKSKAVPATCETAGKTVSKCTVCGKEVEKTVPATGHQWEDNPVSTTEASCGEAAVATYKCKNCTATKEVTLDKLPHSFGTPTEVKNSAAATSYVYTCSKCGAVVVGMATRDVTAQTTAVPDDGKLANGTEYSWSIPAPKAGKAIVSLFVKTGGNTTGGTYTWKEHEIKANGVAGTCTITDKTYSDSGVTPEGAYVEFGIVDLIEGENIITIKTPSQQSPRNVFGDGEIRLEYTTGGDTPVTPVTPVEEDVVSWNAKSDIDASLSKDYEDKGTYVRINTSKLRDASGNGGTILGYKVNSPKAVEHAKLYIKVDSRTDTTKLFGFITNDSTVGYAPDGNGGWAKPTSESDYRVGIKINGVAVPFVADTTFSEGVDQWFPVKLADFPLKQGENTLEFEGYAGYRLSIYEFKFVEVK